MLPWKFLVEALGPTSGRIYLCSCKRGQSDWHTLRLQVQLLSLTDKATADIQKPPYEKWYCPKSGENPPDSLEFQ